MSTGTDLVTSTRTACRGARDAENIIKTPKRRGVGLGYGTTGHFIFP